MKRIIPFDKKIFTVALALLLPLMCASPSARTARAEESTVLTGEDFSISLPDSYEQYLPLDTVSDLSFRDGNIAVADGKELYVYNGMQYLRYEHTLPIEQVEFTTEGKIYFLDRGMSMYSVDYTHSPLTAGRMDTNCTSFTYVNGDLYYADLNAIYRLGESDSIVGGVSDYPHIAYGNDTLYYTVSNYLFVCEKNVSRRYTLDRTPTDVCVDGNVLYACDETGLYAYDLTAGESIGTGQHLASASSDVFSRFDLEKGNIYLSTQTDSNAKIRQFSLQSNSFTDYEIGSASSANNRLLSAQAAAVSEDLLVVADTNRFLIKQGGMSGYKTVPLPFTPRYIATNGSSVLVANDTRTQLYGTDGVLISDLGNRTVRGVACGKETDYYLAAGNSTYYRYSLADKKLDGPFYLNTTFKELTADPYGNLYILDTNGSVYRYTPTELESAASPKLYCTVPSDSRSLRIDRNGDLYALTGNQLLCLRNGTKKLFALSSAALYNAPSAPVAIALNESNGSLSVVYQDCILTTDSEKLALPSLAKMATSDAYTQIYRQEKALSLVRIEANSLQIPFRIDQLSEQSEYFAATTFLRTKNARLATFLAEITVDRLEYYALCPMDGSSAVLVRKEFCTPVPTSDFLRPAEDFIDGTGYLSNDTYLYKFPYIESSLAYERIEKSTAVQIEGYFDSENGAAFYYVTYNGKSGFIPAGYVQKLNTATGETDLLRFTTVRPSADCIATATDGSTVTLQTGKDYTVGIVTNDGATVYIAYALDGKIYYTELPASTIQEENSSYLRYFLVTVLLLADLLLLGNYFYKRRTETV